MGKIADILSGNNHKSTVPHIMMLYNDLCSQIEELKKRNECPDDLWEVYNAHLNGLKKDIMKEGSEDLNNFITFLDENFNKLPESVSSIIQDYYDHPEKNALPRAD